MWSLAPRSGFARALAAAGYLAAVALLVMLQEFGLRLRRRESRAWWAGTGRDVLNFVGFAGVTVALRVYGFPLPPALVVGATLTLALFGTSIFMETRAPFARPREWALGVGLALATPVLIVPQAVLTACGRVMAALFPAG